uniref:Zinc knuckle CX2CX4HX4C n=1 Tax=Tanacetum cinerariifolium TaxID=118510 RepID=A0A699Q614_TANCI|nr:zinc knuckle CX2CX4HX4C [Tanacetum cinerariifolium]
MFFKSIKEGKYADILSTMSTADIDAAVNAIESTGMKFQVTADLNVLRQVVEPRHGVPIVQVVNINAKSTSYTGATGANYKEQPKVNSTFSPLVVEPIFNGVNISFPRKVVKKVSAHLEHTLYGYFIGKRLAFLVVEYYARNN